MQNPSASRIETAPWWVPSALCFLLGASVTAAVMMPTIKTPDYQRGHRTGFDAGYNEGMTKMKAALESLALENNELKNQLNK